MTTIQLAEKLRQMHLEGKKHEEAVIQVIFFGIKYAKDLENCGKTPKTIGRMAFGEQSPYGKEIKEGMKLAKLVKVKNRWI